MSSKKRTDIKQLFDDHSNPATGMHEEACMDKIVKRLFSEEEDKTEDVVFDGEHETTVDLSYQSSDDGLVDSYFAGISGEETEEEGDVEQKLVHRMLAKQNSPNFVRPEGYISLLDIHSGVLTS